MFLVSSTHIPLCCHPLMQQRPLWPLLDLHLLQVFVGGVFIAVVLHLVEVAFLWGQHWVHLQERQSMPTKTDLDTNHCPYNMLRVSLANKRAKDLIWFVFTE